MHLINTLITYYYGSFCCLLYFSESSPIFSEIWEYMNEFEEWLCYVIKCWLWFKQQTLILWSSSTIYIIQKRVAYVCSSRVSFSFNKTLDFLIIYVHVHNTLSVANKHYFLTKQHIPTSKQMIIIIFYYFSI